MSSNSDPWSPQYGTNTFTHSETPNSPSRYSYTTRSDTQRIYFPDDDDTPVTGMRRISLSPAPSQENSEVDAYSDSIEEDEVERTLSNLDNDIEHTENALSQWSRSPSSRSYTSYAGSYTGSYTGTQSSTGYTGSMSYVTLPTVTSRETRSPAPDPGARLSRITEHTEPSSRPSSGAFSASAANRQNNPAPDALRRSMLLGGSSTHSRSTTDPGSSKDLPPPGRAAGLIAQFEANSGSEGTPRSNTPGPGTFSSPFSSRDASQSTPNLINTTGYTISSTGYTYGSGSRPSSPTKSRTGSALSYTVTDSRPTASSFLSPPTRTGTPTGTSRSESPTYTRTGSYSIPSAYTQTPSTYSRTLSHTGTDTRTYTTDTYTATPSNTRTSFTPTASLRRPQNRSPRTPLTSVRNIIAQWKERTPRDGRDDKASVATSVMSASPPPAGRQRIGRDGGRTPTRSQEGDRASLHSVRSSNLPPGFDADELKAYTQSNEPPQHIGQLWYLNVHAPPPYRWQRCQALLYPHMLLLSWLAPGGGRGIVALDLLNCTNVQSAPSPTHPSARDDVGTVAAASQRLAPDGQSLAEILVPFQMLYADGVERLAAESLLERQKWVNRLWETINVSLPMPESTVTRSPSIAGSIRTILSIDSSSSVSSTGSRSTIYVPPLSSLASIPDEASEASWTYDRSPALSRRTSLVGSSYHTRTVDDTVITREGYLYPGDPRAIPSRGNSLRRSGSMTDLDEEFALALRRAKDAKPGLGFASKVLGSSPVTISSGPNLGRNVRMTPPPSARGSDRARSDYSGDDVFYSAGSSDEGPRSSFYSTYTSELQTTTGLRTETSFGPRSMTGTQITPSSYLRSDSTSYLGGSQAGSYSLSPSTRTSLSRAREVRRRHGRSSRSFSSYHESDNSSDKENSEATGSYTVDSGSYTLDSQTYDSRSYTTRSRSFTHSGSSYDSGSYTPDSRSMTSGSYTPSRAAASEIPSSSSGLTPIYSSETGYDVCPSSDFTELTSCVITSVENTVTPISTSPRSEDARVVEEVESDGYLTASQGTEYITADSPLSASSYASFPSIPSESEYKSADSGDSHYKTASIPSEYITAELCPTIPSEASTPTLSSVKLESESGERSVLGLPSGPPSEIPTIRSPSIFAEALMPLPGSKSPSLASVKTSPKPSPQPSPQPVRPRSPSQTPSLLSVRRSPPLPPLPSSPGSILEMSSPTEESADELSTHDKTPSQASIPLSFSDESSLPVLTESVSSASSDLTPSSFALSGSSAPSEAPLTPAPDLPVTVSSPSSSSVSTLSGLTSLTPPFMQQPPDSPTRWAQETDDSYESSQLNPSPSVMSMAMAEGLDASYETSFMRPTGSTLSSIDRVRAIPETPTALSTMAPRTPLPPLTPVPQLSASSRSSSEAPTPSSLSMISAVQFPVAAPPTLTPVSAISSSLPSTADLMTPSSMSFSLGPLAPTVTLRRATSIASSIMSQSSLSSSIFDSRSLAEEEEPIYEIPDVATEPSLLSTPGPSEIHMRSPSLRTPSEGSLVVSISTPRGSEPVTQPSLETLASSVSEETQRDIFRDLDRLADDLRNYDAARGSENQDLAQNMEHLRNELADLSRFLQRTPPTPSQPGPRTIIQHITRTPGSRRREEVTPAGPHVDRSVGDSEDIILLGPGGEDRGMAYSPMLDRASSITDSIGSFLSSHHSEDEYLSPEQYPSSLQWPGPSTIPESEEDEESDVSSFTSSTPSSPVTVVTHIQESPMTVPTPVLSIVERPLPPTPTVTESVKPSGHPLPSSSPSSSTSTTTPRQAPSPPDLRDPLNALRQQLDALWDGQLSTNHMLDELRARGPPAIPDNSELVDRMNRIEDLLRNMQDNLRQQPRAIHAEAPPRMPSPPLSVDSRTSLGSLERQLNSFPIEAPTPRAAGGPSWVQQLVDDMLAVSRVPHTPIVAPDYPRIVPEPLTREARPRQWSPIVTLRDLPPRPDTEPPRTDRQPRYVPRRARPRQPIQTGRSTTETEVQTEVDQRPVPHTAPPPSQTPAPQQRPPEGPDIDMEAEVRRRRGGYYGPPPVPVFGHPESGRSQTAPPERDQQSWYRPSDATPRPPVRPAAQQPVVSPLPVLAPVAAQPTPPSGLPRIPMPPPPVLVQFPVDSFHEIIDLLRHNHEQNRLSRQNQSEMIEYMGRLNNWLQQDYNDRREDLRNVLSSINDLRNGLDSLRTGYPDGSIASTPSEAEEEEEEEEATYPDPRMQMPEPVIPLGLRTPAPGMPTPSVIPLTGGMVMPTPQIPQHMPQPQMPPGPVLPPGFMPYPAQHQLTGPPPEHPVIPSVRDEGSPRIQPFIPPHGSYVGSRPGTVRPMPPPPAGYHDTGPGPMPHLEPPETPPQPFVPPLHPGVQGHPQPQFVFQEADPGSSSSPSSGSTPTRRGHGRSRSRSSSPSPRRSRRHSATTRTPTSGRRRYDRSTRSSRTPSPSPSHDQIPIVIPPPAPGPPIIIPSQQAPDVHRTHTRRSSRSRSRSPSSRSEYGHGAPVHHLPPQVPMQQPPQTIVIQQPPSAAPIHSQPSEYLPPVPGTIHTEQPMQAPAPIIIPGAVPPPMGMGMPIQHPVVVRHPSSSSPRSRRSRSRSRSHSPRRHRTPPPVQQMAPVAIQPTVQQPPMIVHGGRYSPRSSRSRSRSRSPRRRYTPPPVSTVPSYAQPPMMMQPPMMAPGPGMMPIPGMTMVPPMAGTAPPVIIQRSSSRSRSRSRSPRSRHSSPRRQEPIIIQQPPTVPPMQQPTFIPGMPGTAPMMPGMVPPMMAGVMPGMPMSAVPPAVVMARSRSSSRSRSRSRSPRREPHVIVTGPPAVSDTARRRSSSGRRHSPPRQPQQPQIIQAPPLFPSQPFGTAVGAPVVVPVSRHSSRSRTRSRSPRHAPPVVITQPSRGRSHSRQRRSRSPRDRYPHDQGRYSPRRPHSPYHRDYRDPYDDYRRRPRPYFRSPSPGYRHRHRSSYSRSPTPRPSDHRHRHHRRSISYSPTRDLDHHRAFYRYGSPRRSSSYSPRDRGHGRHPHRPRSRSPYYSTRSPSPGERGRRPYYPSSPSRRSYTPDSPRLPPRTHYTPSRRPSVFSRPHSAARTARPASIAGSDANIPIVVQPPSARPPASYEEHDGHRAPYEEHHDGHRPPTVLSMAPSTRTRRTRTPSAPSPYELTPSVYEGEEGPHRPEVIHPGESMHTIPSRHSRLPSSASRRTEVPIPPPTVHVPPSRTPTMMTRPRSPTVLHDDDDDDLHSEAPRPIPAPASDRSEERGRLPSRRRPSTVGRPPSVRRRPSRYSPSFRSSPSSRSRTPPRRGRSVTPLASEHRAEAEAQLARLHDAEDELHSITQRAHDAEDRREDDFRAHEEDRDRLFHDHEIRRDDEVKARLDTIMEDLNQRIAAITFPEPPPVQVPPPAEEEPVPDIIVEPPDAAEVASIHSKATTELVKEVLQTVNAERDELQRQHEAHEMERAALLAEAAEERQRAAEERDARIKALEDELAAVKAELENEKQQRVSTEAEQRERESAALLERDEGIRNQLGDITNLVQDQRELVEQKKQTSDERYQEKMNRRIDKENKFLDLENLVRSLAGDLAETKNLVHIAHLDRESQPNNQEVITVLRAQNEELRGLLNELSTTWRDDCARHHHETIEAVRSTASEQVPFNVQGYLDEFSKALASEVRMLLGEVGKLREERRALQHELGYLLCMKSKYGPGGEFDPEWRPPAGAPGGPPLEPPQPPPHEEPSQPEIPPPAKPGWRTVHVRPTRKKKSKATPPAEPVPGPSQPMGYGPPVGFPMRGGVDPRSQIQSWATWQPDPANIPSMRSSVAGGHLLVPEDQGSPGLFGPRSPSTSTHR